MDYLPICVYIQIWQINIRKEDIAFNAMGYCHIEIVVMLRFYSVSFE